MANIVTKEQNKNKSMETRLETLEAKSVETDGEVHCTEKKNM